MRSHIIRMLLLAQVSYFGCLLVAVCIDQGGFTSDHGLSFYGEHVRTLAAYGIGTIGCSAFLLRAAMYLSRQGTLGRVLYHGLRAVAVLLLLLLVTPDTFGAFLNWSHIIVAVVLFSGELALGGWLAFYACRDLLAQSLWTVQLAAGLAALLSEVAIVQYLSASSLVFQLSFSALVIRAVSRMQPAASQPSVVTNGHEHRAHLRTFAGVARRNLFRTAEHDDTNKQ